MNNRLTELYRSCRPKEALASQDQFKSANALLGTEVEKFAELILAECIDIAEQTRFEGKVVAERIKFVFGVDQ